MKDITELINDMIIDKLKEYNLKTKKANKEVFITNLPMYCTISCKERYLQANFIKAVGKFGGREIEPIIIGELDLSDAANPKFDPLSIIMQGDELYKTLAAMSKLYGTHVEYMNPSAIRALIYKIVKKIMGRELNKNEENIEVHNSVATFRYKSSDIISFYVTTDNKFIDFYQKTTTTMNQEEFELFFKQKYEERLNGVNS